MNPMNYKIFILISFFILLHACSIGKKKYEVISSANNNGFVSVQIYTADTSGTNLSEINDELFSEYKDSCEDLYLTYFDEKESAKKFMGLMFKESITGADDTLIQHNVAIYSYNKYKSARPCLERRGKLGWNEIKCYKVR